MIVQLPRVIPPLIVLPILLISVCAQAAGTAKTAFLGKFTFNWLADPAKTRCVRIDSRLLAALNSPQFHCDPRPRPTSAGVPASVCTKANKTVEYLIFNTLAACEDERETQAANE